MKKDKYFIEIFGNNSKQSYNTYKHFMLYNGKELNV